MVRPSVCDNAPAHSSIIVSQFLAEKRITVINHPPYSPDLPIPKVKPRMKEKRFESAEEIQNNVTRHLRNIPEADFSKMMIDLYDRSKLCISWEGDYVENSVKINLLALIFILL